MEGEEKQLFNLDTEQSVLGCVLIEPECLAVVSEYVSPESFAFPAHSEAFRSFHAITDRGDSIDYVTFADELRRRGVWDQIGGATCIGALTNAVGATTNAKFYAKAVRDYAVRRRLRDSAKAILEAAEDTERPISEVLEESHAALPPLGTLDDDATEELVDTCKTVWNALNARIRNGGKIRGIATGIDGMDYMTSGLKRGNLMIIAGRTSMGKTGLGVTAAMNVAKNGHKVLYFSLEMSREELIERMACVQANLNLHAMQNGDLDSEDSALAGQAISLISTLPIKIDDRPSMNTTRVRTAIAKRVKTHGVDVVFLDHFHLMKPVREVKWQNGAAMWGEISAELKTIAREFNVPVVCLAQLNRQAESRQDKRPQLSDLRDSGRLEEDADSVIGVFRPAYYDKKEAPSREQRGTSTRVATVEEAVLDVLKNRNGPTGTVNVKFMPHCAAFSDPDVAAMFKKPEPVEPYAVVAGGSTTPMDTWTQSFDDDPFA